MIDIWSTANTIAPKSEADVEHLLVRPLLAALGYSPDDIRAQEPIRIQQGRVGRSPAADFVVYDGPLHNRNTSLMVIEVKAPGQKIEPAIDQAESYAMAAAIRAPVILVTNGIKLEVWQLQPTAENERVLALEIRGLPAKRGALEALLSKNALRSYSLDLLRRRLPAVTVDFRKYLTAEHGRVVPCPSAAGRSLQEKREYSAINPERTIYGFDLQRSFRAGAIILGPSGSGKTTLASFLFRHYIDERLNNPEARLPVDVYLPDLGESKILSFIVARLQSHHASVTDAFIRDILREYGATLICDGFNRLNETLSKSVATELRLILRDYPKVQLFVFASEGRAPDLPLDKLSLLPLSKNEQLEIVNALDAAALPFFSSALEPLSKLMESPLLLSLLVKGWQSDKMSDLRILPIFQAWLDWLVALPPARLSERSAREEALTKISEITASGPVDIARLPGFLRAVGINPEVLDPLEAAGAFRRSTNGSLELVHESLSDFLRAKSITSGRNEDVNDKIGSMSIIEGSWLPLLVLLMIQDTSSRAIFWRRAAECNFRVYVALLSHPYGETTEGAAEPSETVTHRLLSDVLFGLVHPLRFGFPALEGPIAMKVSGESDHPLGIVGKLSSNHWLSYSFCSEAKLGSPVVIAEANREHIYGVALKLAALPNTKGRGVGLEVLKRALNEVVEDRELYGGPVWANERLVSDIRFLFGENWLEAGGGGLEEIRKDLALRSGDIFLSSHDFHGRGIPASRLLHDAETLLSGGISAVDCWWRRLGAKRGMRFDDPAWPRLIDEHYRRSQIVFAELVQRSFPGLEATFAFFASLPVRFDVTVTPGRSDWRGNIHLSWRPVDSWDDAGADVTFAERVEWSHTTLMAHVERVRDALRRSGRRPVAGGINFKSGVMWNLDGSTLHGGYDGATSALRQACSWLRHEIDDIFRGSRI